MFLGAQEKKPMKLRKGFSNLSVALSLVAAPAWAQDVSMARPNSEPPPGSEGPSSPKTEATTAAPESEAYSSSATIAALPSETEDEQEVTAHYEDDEDHEYDDYDDGKSKAKNAIYLEGLGPALYYSLNYERILGDVVAARIGAGFMSVTASAGSDSANSMVLAIPVTFSWIGLYSGWHGLELGGGGTLFYASNGASVAGNGGTVAGFFPSVVAFAGYRLHPVDKVGVQFRAGFDFNVFFDGQTVVALPWGHLSLGVAF
jgi:hypothetical protein